MVLSLFLNSLDYTPFLLVPGVLQPPSSDATLSQEKICLVSFNWNIMWMWCITCKLVYQCKVLICFNSVLWKTERACSQKNASLLTTFQMTSGRRCAWEWGLVWHSWLYTKKRYIHKARQGVLQCDQTQVTHEKIILVYSLQHFWKRNSKM